MNPDINSSDSSELPRGWNIPPPEKLPESSIWPATLALALTMSLWGLITSIIITVVGLVLFAVALRGWIQEIRHERNKR